MVSSSLTTATNLVLAFLLALVVLVLLTPSVDGAIHDHDRHDYQYQYQYQYQPYHDDDSAGASYYGSSGMAYARAGYAGGYGGGDDHHAGSGSGRAAAGGRVGGSDPSSFAGGDGDDEGDGAGVHHSSSSSWSEVSVNVVDDAFTTTCPRPTVFVYKDRRYTATASGEVLTIRDCPCTLTTTRSYTVSDGGPVVSTSAVYAS